MFLLQLQSAVISELNVDHRKVFIIYINVTSLCDVIGCGQTDVVVSKMKR